MPRCRICKTKFIRRSMTHTCCSVECSVEFARLKRIKAQAKELHARKVALKSKAQHMRETQAAVNAWVRWRDRELPCISCGAVDAAQWDAGHYFSRGAHPELALDLSNIHKQCSVCNAHKGGNIAKYRPNLIAKIGQTEMDRLEGPHEPAKYTIPELEGIKAHYRAKLRAAKARES